MVPAAVPPLSFVRLPAISVPFAFSTSAVNVVIWLVAVSRVMLEPVSFKVFTVNVPATTDPSPNTAASVVISPCAVRVALPVVETWLTANPSISLKVIVPEPTALLPLLRPNNLSLLTSLVALARVMLPLLAVVTLNASTAIVEPVPTCCTRPTASTVNVPFVVMFERSAVLPEVMAIVPVSD